MIDAIDRSQFALDLATGAYVSPSREYSVLRDIPIQFLDYGILRQYMGSERKFRVRFRGPRHSSNYHTLKREATHFAVYWAD